MNALVPLLVALGVLLVGAWTFQSIAEVSTPEPPLCMADEMQEQVRAIMQAGLDQGLKEHTVHVFDTWLRDPSDQPRRAISGMRIGVSAYVRSRAALAKWDPPRCAP